MQQADRADTIAVTPTSSGKGCETSVSRRRIVRGAILAIGASSVFALPASIGEQPGDEEHFVAAMGRIHPRGAETARAALAEGLGLTELFAVLMPGNAAGFFTLMFKAGDDLRSFRDGVEWKP